MAQVSEQSSRLIHTSPPSTWWYYSSVQHNVTVLTQLRVLRLEENLQKGLLLADFLTFTDATGFD